MEDTIENISNKVYIAYRNKIDKYIIFVKSRWIFTLILFLNYLWRITIYGGFYVVSYVLGLYMLNITVQFFQPLGLPDIDDELEEDEQVYSTLPTTMTQANTDTEAKPLIRSLSEFKYWQYVTGIVIIGNLLTLSKIFDLPVFWPFLLAYFIFLCAFTARKLFKHMNKYNYSFYDDSKSKKNKTYK